MECARKHLVPEDDAPVLYFLARGPYDVRYLEVRFDLQVVRVGGDDYVAQPVLAEKT